jgi:cell shape-determining protein MreD
MGVGFALGLLQGVAAGRWLGAYACAQVLAGYGGGELRRLVFVDNPYVRLGAVAALTAVAQVVFLALSGAAGWGEGAGMAAGRALYHAALSPLAFAALGPAEGKEAKP